MKKLFLFLFTTVTVFAKAQQTVEKITEKYAADLGGLAAFNKIKSAKLSGSVAIQGMDFPITMEILNGKGIRMDVDVMGQSITQVYFNGKGWQVNPIGGITSPTEMTGTELLGIKSQASLANNLVDYKSRGHQIVLEGEETVEGVKTQKIKLTHKEDGSITYYFITSSDNILLKTATTRNMNGQNAEVETWYSNYKNFGDVKIATVSTQKINGEVTREISWSSIELDVKVDEKIFAQ